uniref:Putative effector protein n=1 Tax=Heterodera avenae TaxID=34510 RepID=A0A2L0VDM3_HETAV|nr:putative effector protein [Heterodera avenae]
MNPILFWVCIGFAIQCNVQNVLSDVNATLKQSYSIFGVNFVYSMQLKNNDASKTVCSVEFSLITKESTSAIINVAFDTISDAPNHYKVFADIAPGATLQNSGTVTLFGHDTPTPQLIETKYYKNGVCGGSSSAGGGVGGKSSSSPSCSACSSNKKNGSPLQRILNKPFKNSSFEKNNPAANPFGGPWECGRNSSSILSAAVNTALFKAEAQSKADGCAPICNDICVKIDYQGKSLTVPISHKCETCKENQIALTTEAFNILEPNLELTAAKGATLTYKACPSHIKAC